MTPPAIKPLLVGQPVGGVLRDQGRSEEAEVELLEAHEILTAAAGADHDRTHKVVRAPLDLHEAQGKTEKAKEWRATIADRAD